MDPNSARVRERRVWKLNVMFTVFIAEVLSEEPILKWYKDAHVAKGKSVFLEQMKKFVEWLKNAEEGKSFSLCSLFGKAWELVLVWP